MWVLLMPPDYGDEMKKGKKWVSNQFADTVEKRDDDERFNTTSLSFVHQCVDTVNSSTNKPQDKDSFHS